MDPLELVAQIIRSANFTITGNIGTTPDIRYFESGNCVCNFSLAVNRPGAKKNDGQKPDWFRVEAWGEQAQAMADALTKGSRVTVTGRIRSEKYTSKQTGEEVVSLVLRAEEWRTGDATAPTPAAAPAPAATARPAAPATVFQSNGGAGFDDSEVPF